MARSHRPQNSGSSSRSPGQAMCHGKPSGVGRSFLRWSAKPHNKGVMTFFLKAGFLKAGLLKAGRSVRRAYQASKFGW
jgi:hypothetical protein